MPVKQRWGIWQRNSVTKCWSYNHNKRKVNKTVLTCFTIKTISFESNILYHAVTSKIDGITALQIRFLLLILWIYIWKTDECFITYGYNKIKKNGKGFFSGQSILLGINDNDSKHMLTSWTEQNVIFVLCEENWLVSGGSHHKRSVIRGFGVFCIISLSLNKLLTKLSSCR